MTILEIDHIELFHLAIVEEKLFVNSLNELNSTG